MDECGAGFFDPACCCQKASTRRGKAPAAGFAAGPRPYDRPGGGRRRPSRADAAVAARRLCARDRQRRRPDGRHGLLARLALARSAARRDLGRQAGLAATSSCGRPAASRSACSARARRRSRASSPRACRRSCTGTGVETREGQIAPLIEGALGWIEARTVAEHDVGDHTFFVGDGDRRRSKGRRRAPSCTGTASTTPCDRRRRLRPGRRADRSPRRSGTRCARPTCASAAAATTTRSSAR